MADTDVTARYMLEQAAEGRQITDEMVAELALSEDVDTQLVNGLNTINAIRASGGFEALPFARAVAAETARRIEEKTTSEPRVRQATATVDDDEHAAVMRRLAARRLPYGAGYR